VDPGVMQGGIHYSVFLVPSDALRTDTGFARMDEM
jgi:hypothetical protein